MAIRSLYCQKWIIIYKENYIFYPSSRYFSWKRADFLIQRKMLSKYNEVKLTWALDQNKKKKAHLISYESQEKES